MVIPFLRSALASRAAAGSSSSICVSRFASSLSTLTSNIGAGNTVSSSAHYQAAGENIRLIHSAFSPFSSHQQLQQHKDRRNNVRRYGLDHNEHRRYFSVSPTPPPAGGASVPTPPAGLTNEMAIGVQDATLLFIRHGLGKRRLDEIGAEAEKGDVSLVSRWQKMMEAFLATQVHVLAGLGYPPDDQGLGLYNSHLATLLQSSDPTTQEKLRESGRDTWREVLCTAFGLQLEEVKEKELSIVEARNIMHKVSQRMQEPDILEEVAKRCASQSTVGEGGSSMSREETVFKHTVVQDVLVNNVYLGEMPGTSKSLVSECGFGEGEKGYVLLQCAMAEYQSDPLVGQYIGTAMMRIMQSAGLDMNALKQGAGGSS
mmetsp:Transcript_15324/g.20959  ORF Transcript_15324/g.20959 Transcript_15324/m.20959 type:complete len:372 (-) Transcript_15324:152-1267(-)|eukprot:CAMPEP_0185728728 /NCGR_PEP_ID=MMETSP1171-20130828/4093_1 /TAXON_ID=374046 /ORGANISM="Helicotheca tamensis, Strain CCMP826" /LENGTH=371 /DNA_ID=CAMNT_0028397467 /DNA_START=69 /DNA_END=1187 /DNA_ORIENTATION=-